MKMFNFRPMVFDHIDKEGIWWKGSKDGFYYVFHWNPIKVIIGWLKNGMYIGFLPFRTKHLR